MTLIRIKQLLTSLITMALVACVAGAAHAQDNYPSKPVRILVGFAPGGLTDVYARLFAAHMQAKLGQPFIVENKPGAATGRCPAPC